MKVPMQILRISAGKIEDGGMLYANAIILDSSIASTIESDRIDVGQQHAKIRMNTDNNNQLARDLANSGLVPNTILVDVETSVRKGEVSMTIIGFDKNQKAA